MLMTTFTLVSLLNFLSMGKKQVYGRCGSVLLLFVVPLGPLHQTEGRVQHLYC
jgi:hypothetical protein